MTCGEFGVLPSSHWKCESCGNVYTIEEYNVLHQVQAVGGEENPTAMNGHGYHKVCDCGFEFHADGTNCRTRVEHQDVGMTVSTVFLYLNHGDDNNPLWYETAVMHDHTTEIIDRYPSLQAALEGHSQTVQSLRNGNFDIQTAVTKITLNEGAGTSEGGK